MLHSERLCDVHVGCVLQIILDDKEVEEDPATTNEVKQCLEDIKVCGPSELCCILRWRREILKKTAEKHVKDSQAETEGGSDASQNDKE